MHKPKGSEVSILGDSYQNHILEEILFYLAGSSGDAILGNCEYQL